MVVGFLASHRTVDGDQRLGQNKRKNPYPHPESGPISRSEGISS